MEQSRIDYHIEALKEEKAALEKRIRRKLTRSEQVLILLYIEAFPEMTYTDVWGAAWSSTGR